MSRNGIQGFQAERFAQVIAARRLTQTQLASMIDVSPSTISKWRSGAQMPERDALERLARVVNVRPEWFTRPVTADASNLLFRSMASAHKSARSMLSVRLAWAQEVASALNEFVDFPEVNLPKRMFINPEEITQEEIEEAASDCREIWGVGSSVIQDLALAAEGAGIVLIREETGIAQIEGLSAWSSAIGRPFILLSSDKDNGYRSRFDLAHEIGHLVLHRHIQNPWEKERHDLLEKQAHSFAGALLLPAETFASEVRLPPTLDELLLLKRRWGVSAAAITMRLYALGLIDDEQRTYFFKRRSARWGAKSEPGDGDRVPERARLLRRSIDLVVDEGVMPLSTIPQHIGLSSSDIESLTGLPHGYFRGADEFAELARLRKPSQDVDGDSKVVMFQRR
ncbi:phage-related DNA-binding protein [Salinisphaera shabanensis T35B1]|uniref:XRE family transcriptional regulator n=1 Tax=Salinisphaera shabanensis TaxID=180542 RepID=UPI00333F9BB3